ncbi:MAG TPA: ABC transporter permease [Pyrinomonadaceae bacterium]|jgi:putative ABC transport system permease protein|nr:ABC transporter permease [Pyrinomonadaceae bacterium]
MDNLVFSNMFHRPARTLVSVMGIAVGVLLIVFTIGLTEGSLRERAAREGNVGAEIMYRASGTRGMSGSESFRLPVSDGPEIAKVEGVKAVVALGQNTVSTDDNNTGSRLIDGINFEEYAAMAGLGIIQGRPLGATGDEAIIDTAWQRQKKAKVGDQLQLYERDFTIVGTFEPAAGAHIKIPLSTMQELLGSEGKCNSFLISVKEGNKADDVAARIQEAFPKSQILLTRELEELYMNSIPALNIFLNVIVGVAAVISALVVLLTMYTTVTERTRQIGILKSMGMSPNGIAWIIVQEAMLLSLLGVMTGAIFTILLAMILTRTTSLQIALSPKIIGLTFVIGLIGGTLGALYPAMRAARMDAVEALSYE